MATCAFETKNYIELIFHKIKKTCLSREIYPFGKFKKLMIVIVFFGSSKEALKYC
jgi:hypothetical protein